MQSKDVLYITRWSNTSYDNYSREVCNTYHLHTDQKVSVVLTAIQTQSITLRSIRCRAYFKCKTVSQMTENVLVTDDDASVPYSGPHTAQKKQCQGGGILPARFCYSYMTCCNTPIKVHQAHMTVVYRAEFVLCRSRDLNHADTRRQPVRSSTREAWSHFPCGNASSFTWRPPSLTRT